MKIHFIKHSSFLLETDKANFLFDYYEGDVPSVDKEKVLYVLASHSHGDHFSEKVFEAVKDFENVQFVLSDDIFANRVPEIYRQKTTFVSPYQTVALPDCEIETLQSTDLGVAFLIKSNGQTIYHAGDLNAWVWSGASAHQNRQMLEAYTQEIERLKGTEIDLAFVPLDPRQEENFSLSMQLFIEEVNPKQVVPMHMWGDFSVVPAFKKRFPQYAERMLNVEADGDCISII
ncbi:MBL fold metallo-hydrolase [Scatolibacter rhodanostii]|uniref:MBL fold metallo-hydrolase n=1 Tax=Scatolibacter rhodanostii TaxID=2014781 RepID=UPI000C08CD45|nr:MBL fold metallo-hydrolase [Scatolibacter rhodanostii]